MLIMPLRKALNIFLLIILIFSACKTSRKAQSKAPTRTYIPSSRQEYIEEYSALAIEEMHRTGIPASITLAQAVLESGNGNSTLARNSNNHFGIKCHSDWKGKTFTWDDDKKNECFRKYNSVYDSYRDHSDFLKNKSRYAFLFELKPTDYKGWSKGLKKAGYATNPKYAHLLIGIIEDNNLTAYDKGKIPARKKKADQTSQVLIPQPSPLEDGDIENAISSAYEEFVIQVGARKREINEINRVDYITIRPGDTFESLAEEFELLKWELSKYNELSEGANLEPGQIIYLQPKRSQAEKGNMFHIVGENESMWDIAQQYGVKTKKLYEMNDMKKGQNPQPGQKLKLREK